jgi:alcohol dehydrogenase
LAEALGVADSSLSAPDNAARAADAIASFYESVGMPVRLSNVGIPEGDLPRIAQDAQEEFGIRRNARPVTGPEDLMPLLREIY